MRKLFATSACAIAIAILSACSNDPQIENQLTSDAAQAQENSQYLNGLADTLNDRWLLTDNGLVWDVNDSHQDHIEMSGEQASAIIYYGSDADGSLTLNRKLVWPMLRTIPNDTHASLIHDFPLSVSPRIAINGQAVEQELLKQASIDGRLTLTSQIGQGITLTRLLSASTRQPVMVEALTFSNASDKTVALSIDALDYRIDIPAEEGVYGSYRIEASSDKVGEFNLEPDDSLTIYVDFKATKAGQNRQFDGAKEIILRDEYVATLNQNLQLITPDENINKMFEFAKLRSAESIFRTKGGLMHAPGGGRYYAAIWANDQAEYINPFFPFLGNDVGNESAINSFEHFARFMNDEGKAIPSSIIAEGDDIWNGAGDRGDCAMIAYGASRFALAYGDEEQAKALLPLIDWCIDFSYAKQTDEGVIASDSDELEGRFPAGDVNLSTNMLTYGALISASHLNNELGRSELARDYQQRAKKLAKDIEAYFGANVQGFDTYQYYEGNDKLRAWIALPFSFGVFDRKDQTLAAVLSEHLWSADGIYSEAGNKTFWDRATLYAFRGIFAAQETDTAMRYFKYYSRKRLLGEHVPYAVEAWPEGDQRHLSAESALYARVVTEGIFGIEPTGFKRFELAPYLPATWDNMCLKHIRAFESNFDVCVSRVEGSEQGFNVTIEQELGELQQFSWDGQAPISVSL
ncbi:hypothetical protein L2719_16570 [Shewanella schlegeliana]|uniref:Six-hairpin glycosidase-like protein n=1 Tax=Shewanella schlegeliana TaxID=190308 RepID=A0ABS1SXR1_9GAMM|nr:hypothetical protein [Shewanella schlegeliana]MBL4913135.1 hypothetical protein [Shewanella schlegeliana]MCL1111149.1 hypothetical protein [Shewanella schlegeliana]GIU28092.1 hypothetical protein TUM4433_15830 [Shewanella schlegeliana]